MPAKFRVVDYDIIYLSYDEPNAEKNYADLCSKIPWAKRVHGVKGSDAAHKACAELSETERFITVDGDNVIDKDFLSQTVEFQQIDDFDDYVVSWSARNHINGLEYGNGGIKCWPKKYVLNMQTHENADPENKRAQVDFCWDIQYLQIDGCMSTICNNASPFQAWRAGFREGVKMALDQGEPLANAKALLNSHWKNLHRLYIWTMVGSDIENGKWAILGAREGLHHVMCIDWDHVNVRDFDHLWSLWTSRETLHEEHELESEIAAMGRTLIDELSLPISPTPLDSGQSKFFKTVYLNPSRSDLDYKLI